MLKLFFYADLFLAGWYLGAGNFAAAILFAGLALFLYAVDAGWLFIVVSFLFHPIEFVKGWNYSRKHFDKNGYPRDGSI
jgi:hypothetical protein